LQILVEANFPNATSRRLLRNPIAYFAASFFLHINELYADFCSRFAKPRDLAVYFEQIPGYWQAELYTRNLRMFGQRMGHSHGQPFLFPVSIRVRTWPN
jgi:hypothetical protein